MIQGQPQANGSKRRVPRECWAPALPFLAVVRSPYPYRGTGSYIVRGEHHAPPESLGSSAYAEPWRWTSRWSVYRSRGSPTPGHVRITHAARPAYSGRPAGSCGGWKTNPGESPPRDAGCGVSRPRSL
jgi:hypothetical protein